MKVAAGGNAWIELNHNQDNFGCADLIIDKTVQMAFCPMEGIVSGEHEHSQQ
jgi:hypothetical protein